MQFARLASYSMPRKPKPVEHPIFGSNLIQVGCFLTNDANDLHTMYVAGTGRLPASPSFKSAGKLLLDASFRQHSEEVIENFCNFITVTNEMSVKISSFSPFVLLKSESDEEAALLAEADAIYTSDGSCSIAGSTYEIDADKYWGSG